MVFDNSPQNNNSSLIYSEKSNFVPNTFAGFVTNIFQSDLGVTNPSIADHIAGILLKGMRQDEYFGLKTLDGKAPSSILEAMKIAESEFPKRRIISLVSLGDYALFSAGVFYDPSSKSKKEFTDTGKRAYEKASEIEVFDNTEDMPSSDLLYELSENFELCAYGVAEVMREFHNETKA